MRRFWIVVISCVAAAAAAMVFPPWSQAALDRFSQAGTLTNADGASGDETGSSVAVSADGSTMVVGVPGANEAYVYTRGANGWQTANQPDVLSASNAAGGDQFGHSVSISQNGSVIAVGAIYADGGGDLNGEVYVFDRPGGGWASQATQNETAKVAGPADYDLLGAGVALSPNGTYLAAGAPGYSSSGSLSSQGGIYLWTYDGTTLSTIGTEPLVAASPAENDDLGDSVAMPSDGLIYAGAPFHTGGGAVYGFSSESSAEVGYTPWAHVSSTALSVGGSSSLFGVSVADDGGVLAVGAPGTSSYQGAVYLMEPSFHCPFGVVNGCFSASSFTSPVATLTDPSGTNRLGQGVALPGNGAAVLVGAPGLDSSPPHPEGRAYVYQEPASGWADAASPDATLQPQDPAAGDGFGAAVSMSSEGGALGVGDPADASGMGEADVYQGQAGVAVACQPAPVGVGQQTTCTATVTDDGIGDATPAGTVGFGTDSSGTFGSSSCTLSSTATGTSSCHVTYTPSAANSGTHTITAQYSGDDEHASASGTLALSIDHVTTSTTVSCNPSPVTVGATADCTATVTAAGGSAGPPTGNVAFTTNGPGKFSASGCTLPTGSGSTAECKFTYTASQIGPGTHQLTAQYSGDSGHAASQGTEPLGVAEDSTDLKVSCAPSSVTPGKTTKCTATVSDAGGSGLSPSGRVTGKSTGSGRFSKCTLAAFGTDAARCTLTYEPANAGTPSPRLTLTYAGDGSHFASSASASLKVPASGSPAVTVAAASARGGRLVLKLSCPKTEEYCKVGVKIKVGSATLATGSAKVSGGSKKSVALKPKASVLDRLLAGRHAGAVTLAVADQSGHHTHKSFAAVLTTGAHLKLAIKK